MHLKLLFGFWSCNDISIINNIGMLYVLHGAFMRLFILLWTHWIALFTTSHAETVIVHLWQGYVFFNGCHGMYLIVQIQTVFYV